jgi:hypothetical protein
MSTLCKKLFGWMRKEKQPSIRFYSLETGVEKLYPITKSSAIKRKFAEDKSQVAVSSANCPGINKVVSTGWVMLAPADFIITTTGDGIGFNWVEPYRFTKFAEGKETYISSHTKEQTEIFLDDDVTLKTVVKIETPWRVEADDDILLLQLPVTYNNEARFTAATGILDLRYAHLMNVQLFWKDLNSSTLIRAGTPLCQYIPISRKALSTSSYNVTIDIANQTDIQKEQEFNYASNCVILSHDTLASRLTRTLAVLNKYKKRG